MKYLALLMFSLILSGQGCVDESYLNGEELQSQSTIAEPVVDPIELTPEDVEVVPEIEIDPPLTEITNTQISVPPMAAQEMEPTPEVHGDPVPVPVSTPVPAPQPVTESPISTCCKVCTTGKACGDSCISASYTCHKGPGCACDAN